MDRIYLRGIQGTYKVELAQFSEHGFKYKMMLIWDYDRIWGSFDFGTIKGMLMIDHGPDKEPPEYHRSDEDEAAEGNVDEPNPFYFDFTWRGHTTIMPDSEEPDALINNPSITKGKIKLTGRTISGYFEGMPVRIKQFKFEGTPLFGPRRVPRSLSSFIDEWNDMAVFEDDVTVSLPPSNLSRRRSEESDGPDGGSSSSKRQRIAYSGSSDDSFHEGDELDSDRDDENNQENEDGWEEACQRLTGIFKIQSAEIEGEWPDKASHVSLRLHVDQEGGKIWGSFDMGICEGYLLGESIDDIEFGRPVAFTYRGREVDTGTSVRGSGNVTLANDKFSISGFFRGIGNEDRTWDGLSAYLWLTGSEVDIRQAGIMISIFRKIQSVATIAYASRPATPLAPRASFHVATGFDTYCTNLLPYDQDGDSLTFMASCATSGAHYMGTTLSTSTINLNECLANDDGVISGRAHGGALGSCTCDFGTHVCGTKAGCSTTTTKCICKANDGTEHINNFDISKFLGVGYDSEDHLMSGTSSSFFVYEDPARGLFGSFPTLEILHENQDYPFAHEAGVFIAADNTLFITSNQYADPATGKKKIQISKVTLDRQNGKTTAEVEEIYPDGVPMGNGGVNYSDGVLFCAQGGPDPSTQAGGLVYMEPHPPYRTRSLISSFHGRLFNSVNDVVVHSDGSIWFTDPIYGYVFDLAYYSGQPFLVNRRLFAMADTGIPDGIKCDVNGNVYSGCGDGVSIWSPGGVLLGKILVDGGAANFCFGKEGEMFILNEHKLWRAQLNTSTKGALLGI
ncbi:hypothetical protein VMCG_07804 [Cytospora schulzeri]|uniref:SMP-30/Gluconolactonase/LRE-like region domain-containing protein n=1 Tax=Cytospora schulzeri TaxID=448051 RepID=A0A423VZH3_9PEZI|nr:hypothetical protein VMCG_07804 [Valsa malicola]